MTTRALAVRLSFAALAMGLSLVGHAAISLPISIAVLISNLRWVRLRHLLVRCAGRVGQVLLRAGSWLVSRAAPNPAAAMPMHLLLRGHLAECASCRMAVASAAFGARAFITSKETPRC